MDPDLAAIAACQGGVVLRRQALVAGYAPAEIARLLRNEWARVRPGAYVERSRLTAGDPAELHRLRVRAVLAATSAPAVVCGVSAAVLHGLDLWNVKLGHVQVSAPGRSGIEGDVHWHRLVPAPEDLRERDGVVLTSVPSTVVDVARTHSFESGVVAADSGLRRLDGARTPFDDALARCRPRASGTGRARRVLQAADGLAQNPAESRTRVALIGLGFPPATPQVAIYDDDRVLIGIVDLVLLGHSVLVEFDGRMKYGINGTNVKAQLVAEKIRGDRLVDVGYELTRPMWADLDTVARLERRVRGALARAAQRPVPGGWYRLSELRDGQARPCGPFLRPYRA